MRAAAAMRIAAAGLVLGGLTAAVFWPAVRFDFINYDDDVYVYANPLVASGLSLPGVKAAFTTTAGSNWMPLTWLSLMADTTLFGTAPRGYHRTAVLLHTASVVLLFVALRRLTRRPWASALAAALFAVHPTRLESVAWIAERKDVLSGLFFMLALGSYARCAGTPTPLRRLSVTGWFLCGLLAKPMLVTFPFLLLLLDAWPLRRWRSPRDPALKKLFAEKIPLFALAFVFSVITYLIQLRAGAVARAAPGGPAWFGRVVTHYGWYLAKAVWPTDLALVYPSDLGLLPWAGLIAAGLSLLTLTAWGAARRCPAGWIGWCWFAGLLFPVCGVVPIGHISVAARYLYLPLIGLAVALVHGTAAALDRRATWRPWAGLAGALLAAALALETRRQLPHWRDSETLFAHTLRVTSANPIVHYNLACTRARAGRHAEALAEFRRALAARPNYSAAWIGAGHAWYALGHADDAARCYRRGLALPDAALASRQPGSAVEMARLEALNNLAWMLATRSGTTPAQAAEAVRLAEEAVRSARCDLPGAFDTLAAAYAAAGQWDRALETAQRAIALAKAQGDRGMQARMEQRRAAYRTRRPWREEDPAAGLPRPGSGDTPGAPSATR